MVVLERIMVKSNDIFDENIHNLTNYSFNRYNFAIVIVNKE